MKLHVLSDLHTEFQDFQIPETEADVVVLAGDISVGPSVVSWAAEATEKPVVLVVGNHEYFKQYVPKFIGQLRDSAANYPHVHLLLDDQVVIDGVRFLGTTLWTNWQLLGNPMLASHEAEAQVNDFRVIRTEPGYRKLRAVDTLRWHQKSVVWLCKQLDEPFNGKTVVVTHHAPSARSVPDKHKDDTLSAAYASPLDNLVETSGAAVWVHGHIHDSQDYQIGGVRVVCNPRGYADVEVNPDFDPGLIVTI